MENFRDISLAVWISKKGHTDTGLKSWGDGFWERHLVIALISGVVNGRPGVKKVLQLFNLGSIQLILLVSFEIVSIFLRFLSGYICF